MYPKEAFFLYLHIFSVDVCRSLSLCCQKNGIFSLNCVSNTKKKCFKGLLKRREKCRILFFYSVLYRKKISFVDMQNSISWIQKRIAFECLKLNVSVAVNIGNEEQKSTLVILYTHFFGGCFVVQPTLFLIYWEKVRWSLHNLYDWFFFIVNFFCVQFEWNICQREDKCKAFE